MDSLLGHSKLYVTFIYPAIHLIYFVLDTITLLFYCEESLKASIVNQTGNFVCLLFVCCQSDYPNFSITTTYYV